MSFQAGNPAPSLGASFNESGVVGVHESLGASRVRPLGGVAQAVDAVHSRGYRIQSGAGGENIYICEGCNSLYFSRLLEPIQICLTCLFKPKFRLDLMKHYGTSDKQALFENTMRSHSQVAEIMGITRQRVRQIEIYALSKVRAYLIKSTETHIPFDKMNNCAIVGTLVRDAAIRESAKTGKKFVTATVVTEKPSPQGDGTMFSTYWDVLSFGDRPQTLVPELKEGTLVYATGEAQSRTYENKDGVTKAGLKLVGNLGLLKGSPIGGGVEEPVF